jgi:Vps51/Vps67
MTIDEMRDLHHRALQDAEAKRTELRLVLASRYRELVGSSDEVLKMRERSEELHELVHALPGLLSTLVQEKDQIMMKMKMEEKQSSEKPTKQQQKQEETKEAAYTSNENHQLALLQLRRQVSTLPRLVHRALDQHNLHGAALNLIHFFTLLAQQTDAYPLATALAKSSSISTTTLTSTTALPKFQDAALQAQMKMTFLHVQTIPDKIARLAQKMLEGAASYGPLLIKTTSSSLGGGGSDNKPQQPPIFGTQWSAAALSALDLLDRSGAPTTPARASKLLDLYYDSKAKLLQSLLDQLHTTTTTNAAEISTAAVDTITKSSAAAPDNAEEILSKILLILQYDVILHPYQLFVLRNFPVTATSKHKTTVPTSAEAIVASLPSFDPMLVRAKCSNFLAQHLPLLRTKVKSILISIAGTTASALGQMRQSLYDKTDGADCMALLKDSETNLCSWEDALSSLVDISTVAAGGGMPVLPATEGPKFSLWSALFSNTFSSLVHNILTTSFHSVHTKVVSTLRTSLASAPHLEAMLPHEAYKNTLKIATDLDQALW